MRPVLIGLGWLSVAVTVGLVLWVAVGPGALWVLRNFDKVLIGGMEPTELAEALDRVRGRAVAIGTGMLAAIAIIYTAANAASARRTADAAFKAAESSEQTTRASIQSAEAATRTAAATERGLTTGRFTAAVAQLGENSPAIRLGGVHALAGIADDEPSMRQTCIDVLCAYLRLPYDPDPGEAPEHAEERKRYRGRREVRHTIIRLIGHHLRLPADHPHSWQGHDFDFTDVVFDGGDLHGAHFSGGSVSFVGAEFSGGRIAFNHAEFSGGTVDFTRATFSGGSVSFGYATFSGGSVDFEFAEFSGERTGFEFAKFSGGSVNFGHAKFSRERTSFGHAKFSGGRVGFVGAEFSGGTVDFTRATFSGGAVDFGHAKFSGGSVNFAGAKFSHRRVDFMDAEFSGGQVAFWGASGACPDGLPGSGEEVPEGLMLPAAWRSAGGGEDPVELT
ncbi:pentapeptide repeat-containing protein [Actinocorallia populi]|uniref:pentapeptide repeat-containing protein n=1 Tax=Actinocorallia populi TaxID=2079200 RepID=UPI0018E4E83C|nr:pentapeptide repeat-containing protein [Actinocorallia populi]